MSDRIDLDWLADERLAPIALSPDTTARARALLLDHTGGDGRRAPAPAVPGSRPARRRRGEQARRLGLTMVLATGAAAIAFVATSGSGAGTHRPLVRTTPTVAGHRHVHAAGATRPVVAPPLDRLTSLLLSSPTPVGDATLVIRRQTYPNAPEIEGADLYLDNGDYYYSPEPSGLPALMQAHETVNLGDSDSETRDIAAAQSAFTGPIEQARHRMAIANLDPNVKPHAVYPTGALAARLKQLRAKTKAEPPASPDVLENGMIWDNSMDALLAGAGNPQVRAGVLHLLGTVPQITVTQGTVDGQPALTLTASLWSPDHYQENLIINADTGIPIEFIGGTAGQAPTVTVTYSISRVESSAVENGDFAPASATRSTSTSTTPASNPTTTPNPTTTASTATTSSTATTASPATTASAATTASPATTASATTS